MTKKSMQKLIDRIDVLADRLEAHFPTPPSDASLDDAIAFRWRRSTSTSWLQAVPRPHVVSLDDLQGIDRQREVLERNTRQFIAGRPANNALLWGSRGTGKSSLVKALLNAYHAQGLRLIEVEKTDLMDLPDIVERVEGRRERFIVFSDDLSFDAGDGSYKALKAVLDGSVQAPPENVLIYATSNRRHLLPEYMSENQDAHVVDGEIHQGEAVEEKISLSERFGIWLSFYPFKQDEYLEIVRHWLATMGVRMDDEARAEALKWALARGSRSGRSGYQFARDWAGRRGLAE